MHKLLVLLSYLGGCCIVCNYMVCWIWWHRHCREVFKCDPIGICLGKVYLVVFTSTGDGAFDEIRIFFDHFLDFSDYREGWFANESGERTIRASRY